MRPEIIRYRSPRALVDRTNPIEGTVVTAQRLMARALSGNGATAYDVKSVLEALLPDWYDRERHLRQYLLVAGCLDELSGEYAAEIINAFRNNMRDVLHGLRTLAEIGLPVECLPEEGEEERILRRLYETFLKDPEGGATLLEERLSAWESPCRFKELLRRCRIGSDGPLLGVPSCVYFQGFYYVRPMQSRLMKAFEALDIPVYFLNAHDEKHPYDYEVWTHNPLFADMKVHRIFGDSDKEPIRGPEIIRFENVFAMVSRLRNPPEKLRFFAPLRANVRELLDSFFPKLEEKENLLAYPAGRYLWGLYSMWDPVAKDLILEPDTVRECLATGWAGPKFAPESDALLGTFERVKHYFSDCRTTDEWIERRHLLVTDGDRILRVAGKFGKPSEKRWRRPLSNASERIGIMGEDRIRLRTLIATLKQMIADARALFDGSEEVNLLQHFDTLRTMITQKADVRDLQAEERNIVKHFQRRLTLTNTDIRSCSPSLLPEAMGFFLGGKLLSEEDDETSSYEKIYGLSDIESAHFFGRNEAILLCCCDAQTLPTASRDYNWPMNAAFFDEIRLLDDAKEVAKRLDGYRYFVENAVLSDRYLFRVAQSLPNLKLSWVAVRNGKELQPSPYLELMRDRYDVEVKREEGLLLQSTSFEDDVRKVSDDEMRRAVDLFLPGHPRQPVDVSASRESCPHCWRRVWYDYGVSTFPIFCSEFHLGFFFTALIAVRSVEGRRSVEKVAEELFNAYPAFSESKRREITDFAIRQKKKVNLTFLSGEHPSPRLFMQFLGIKEIKQFIETGKLSEPYKEKLCNYCPHKSFCRGLIDKEY